MNFGYFRAGSACPSLSVADPQFNAGKIVGLVKEASSKNVRFLVFPELSVTAYTCQDLFLQRPLQESAVSALLKITKETACENVLFAVGLPLAVKGCLYNCAAFIHKGKVLCIIPKTFIPNYGEFYENRWFTSFDQDSVSEIDVFGTGEKIPFGKNIIIQDKNDSLVRISCEICEDLWVPLSPSTMHAINGATVIANLSASNEVVGKAAYRKILVGAQSAKSICAYIYSNAGHDESTTDLIFSGHSIIAENGKIKKERKLFSETDSILYADIDLEKIHQDRIKSSTFTSSKNLSSPYTTVLVELQQNNLSLESAEKPEDIIEKHPFVPENKGQRHERCREVIEMQSEGLAKRLRHINASSAVIGLSGGLDSTLALLVTARAFDKCGINRNKIKAITMPCFGTTDRTYSNACILARQTGAELIEINIKKSVLQHFADIGQDESKHDITYENCQARERTQILMDYANKTGGIVIGTGDLSELALGWCTYNGDHMSMYAVNSSIPKTLVRYLVDWFAGNESEKLSTVLKDILDTPVSPELLPPEKGNISQKTEDLVGPYELHDFFLYYVMRFGFSPRKIFFLAKSVFDGEKIQGRDDLYTVDFIYKWLVSFYRRFFQQQFKRSCMPDGAKVGTVNLSPRGDWRMPSDASCSIWQKELEDLSKELKC